MKRAAASLIKRDGKYLVVRSARGFSLPGGKIEAGETLFEANARELREETGLFARNQALAYQAVDKGGFQTSIHIVIADGEPRGVEPGTAVTWFTEEQLIDSEPFGEFYEKMFAYLRAKGLC